MTEELTDRIAGLSDDAAVFVLAYVLDEAEPTMERLAQFEQAERVLPEALPQAADLVDPDEVARDVAAGRAPGRGELARSALRYLAGQDAMRAQVARALDVPRPVMQRDLATLAVGGLVLLVLTRTGVKLERDKEKRWSFQFEIKPMRDSAVAGLVRQLFEYCFGPRVTPPAP